jgi:hypothetical protein
MVAICDRFILIDRIFEQREDWRCFGPLAISNKMNKSSYFHWKGNKDVSLSLLDQAV